MKTKPTAPLAVALIGALLPALGVAQTTLRASVGPAEVQGNNFSYGDSLSADGRYVAFWSLSTNLFAGDANGATDVFLRDLEDGTTTCISVDVAGNPGDGDSDQTSLSADGRCVGFTSAASSLVPSDTNGVRDVFVRDLAAGTTTRVSVSSAGVQSDQDSGRSRLSADGRYVVFDSRSGMLVSGDANGRVDVFVHDRQTGQTSCVSVDAAGAPGDQDSIAAAISGDGRYVAFASLASNLVPGDTNARQDVFVRDLQAGQTLRASVANGGLQANGDSSTPALSADGRCVAFSSWAWNLVPGDTNPFSDVFVRDLQAATTERVSVDSSGAQANGDSFSGAISADGRHVAFYSYGTHLVAGDTNGKHDAFVHDRVGGWTTRESIAANGAQASGAAFGASPGALSADGRRVVFYSDATNLVPGDSNQVGDVFVRDRQCDAPAVYCTAKVNSLGCTPAIASTGSPSASAGSGFVVSVTQLLNNKSGRLFYGLTGQQATPLSGGTLCVRPPLLRTPVQDSGGNPPPLDCSGALAIDFNAYIAGGPDPMLVPGIAVDCQFWSRDPGFAPPDNTNLSDAIHFGICP